MTSILCRRVWNNCEEYPYLYRTFESFYRTYPRTYIVRPRIVYDENQGYCEWRLNERYVDRHASLHLCTPGVAQKLDSLLRTLCTDTNLYSALSQKRSWISLRDINAYRTGLLKSANHMMKTSADPTIEAVTSASPAMTAAVNDWRRRMYKHQKWSLATMQRIEDEGIDVQVSFPNEHIYFSPLLMTFMTTRLPPIRGGILADDMGLGKTLTLIALSCRRRNDRTLVVCPPAILDQWSAQVGMWTGGAARCQTYYGQNRRLLAAADDVPTIIITTYGVLRKEIHDDSRLAQASFDRVIFDECHIIKSEKSKQFSACMRVRAPLRWCVSGTPAPSSRRPDKDIVKQFHLIAPAYVPHVQSCQIFNFVDAASTLITLCGIRHHRSLLQDIHMNYTVNNVHLSLDSTSLHRYQTLVRTCSNSLINISNLDLCRWTNKMLCKMACGFHRETNFGFHYDQNMTEEAIEIDEECSICLQAFSDPVITPCSHVYCAKCLDQHFEYSCRCPLCRGMISRTQCMLLHDALPRTNIKAHWLVNFLSSHADERILVMSQFRTTLEWVAQLLERRHIKCCHIMNATRPRIRRTIDSFKDGENTVLLLNARTSTGLDLHCADHVIFMELLPRYVESQAIARASRMGRNHRVQIHRLLVEDSIESFLLTTRSQRASSSMQLLRRYLTPSARY